MEGVPEEPEIRYDAERAPKGYALVQGSHYTAEILFDSSPNDPANQTSRVRVKPPFYPGENFLWSASARTAMINYLVTTADCTLLEIEAEQPKKKEEHVPPDRLRAWVAYAAACLVASLDEIATGEEWSVFARSYPAALAPADKP